MLWCCDYMYLGPKWYLGNEFFIAECWKLNKPTVQGYRKTCLESDDS